MAKNTSIILGDHFDSFVADQLETGRYSAASEVIREGLRLLEEREQRMEGLRLAIKQGLESGFDHPLDFDAYLEDIKGARVQPQ